MCHLIQIRIFPTNFVLLSYKCLHRIFMALAAENQYPSILSCRSASLFAAVIALKNKKPVHAIEHHPRGVFLLPTISVKMCKEYPDGMRVMF